MRRVLFLLLCISTVLYSQDVSEPLAMRIADNYSAYLKLADFENITYKNVRNVAVNSKRIPHKISPKGKADMWFIPIDEGWVLVSGDIKATPILAFIPSFDCPIYDSLPNAAKELYGTYEDYLFYLKTHPNKYQIDSRWQSLIRDTTSNIQNMRAEFASVGPLLGNLHWGQSGGGSCITNKIYNKYCPTVSNPQNCNRAPVGCVAVAVAQIMWYWRWPYAAYIPTTPGGSTEQLHFYDWSLMPEYIDNSTTMDEVDMIAGFLKDCGYKLDMDYGADGSGATDDNALKLLKDFGYDKISIMKKDKWNTEGWTNLLRSNIDNGQPVYYSGYGNILGGDGHAFVVDGYQTGSSPIYHINWGWHDTIANGWYHIDTIQVNSTTNFMHYQSAIFGIKPAPYCTPRTLIWPANSPAWLNFAIGGELTITNSVFQNTERADLSSATQVRLTPGVTIKQGSNVHIFIRDVPCGGTRTVSDIDEAISAPERKGYTDNDEDIKGGDKNLFVVSPNPVDDILTLTTSEVLSDITIYDISGAVMLKRSLSKEENVLSSAGYEVPLDVSSFSSGVYVLSAVTVTGERRQARFIKR